MAASSDLQPLTLTVGGRGGGSSQVDLRQVAAGQYEANVVADTPGAYALTVTELACRACRGAANQTASSCHRLPKPPSFVANEQALRRIASETGGLLLDQRVVELYQGIRNANTTRWDPIWSVFLILGLVTFVLDVAVRNGFALHTRRFSAAPLARKVDNDTNDYLGDADTTATPTSSGLLPKLQAQAIAIEKELAKVIVGYPEVLRGVLITLLAVATR